MSNVMPYSSPRPSAEVLYDWVCKDVLRLDEKRDFFGYWQGEFRIVRVRKEKLEYHYNVARVAKRDLRDIFPNTDEYKAFHSYVLHEKQFEREPYMQKIAHIYSYGELRDGLHEDDYKEMISKEKIVFNLSGRIDVYVPYPPVVDDNYLTIQTIIEIITGEDYELFMNFAAQYAFEDRTGLGRPVLVLRGKRGTGKGFLVEKIISNIMFSMATPLPKNFKKFDGFRESKFIYRDESEGDINVYEMGQFAKELSGSDVASVNKKNKEAYKVDCSSYFCVMTNDKGVHITEKPEDDANNQWVVLNLNTVLNKNKTFKAILEQHNYNLKRFIDRNIGAWIIKVLLPWYEENLLTKPYGRYGFRIPISDKVIELCRISESDIENDVYNFVEKFFSIYDEENFKILCEMSEQKEELLQDFKRLKGSYLLTNQLRTFYCSITHTKQSSFVKQLEKMNLVKDTFNRNFGGKKKRGLELDKIEIERLLTPTEEMAEEDINNIFGD